MEGLITNYKTFYNNCTSKITSFEDLIKIQESYHQLTSSLEENRTNPNFNDWYLENGLFYEMIGNIVKEQIDATKIEDYQKLITTVTLFNNHYQNIITGKWQGANVPTMVKTLNTVLQDMNNFYQKLTNKDDTLLKNPLPTIREKEVIESNEEYLNYLKETFGATYITPLVKEETKEEGIISFDELLSSLEEEYPLVPTTEEEVENTITVTNEELEILRDKLSQKDDKIKALSEERYAQENIITTLNSQNDSLLQTNKNLNQELANKGSELSSLKDQVISYKEQLKTLRHHNQKLQDEIIDLNTRKGYKYYYIGYLNIEEPQEEYAYYIGTPFKLTENALVYNENFQNPSTPLFMYDDQIISALYFKHQNDYLVANDNTMVDRYLKEGYPTSAVKDQYGCIYNINDINVNIEQRKVA